MGREKMKNTSVKESRDMKMDTEGTHSNVEIRKEVWNEEGKMMG